MVSEEDKFVNVFQVNASRNKSIKSINQIKKEIIESRGIFCQTCKNIFDKSYLELDHIIPCALGGKVFDKDNLQLLCKKCHKNKTNTDKLIISFFKKIEFISGRNGAYYFYTKIENLQKIYLSLSKESKICNEMKDDFLHLDNTHSQIYNTNREVYNDK